MRLGALLPPVLPDSPQNVLAEQARRYVGEGFESLWAAQAVGRGFMVTDPLLALAVAASVTEGVALGTAIVQVPLYQTMDLAHRVLSLQQICGDRLILGVGAGSTEQDFAAFERPFTSRFEDFTARMAQLRQVLRTGKLEGADLSAWPAVLGGPPLFLGSWGKGVERAASSFDGWLASAHYRTPSQVNAALARYRRAGGGRAVVSTIILPPFTDLGELKAKLDGFAEAGFDDAVVMFVTGGPEPAAVRRLVR